MRPISILCVRIAAPIALSVLLTSSVYAQKRFFTLVSAVPKTLTAKSLRAAEATQTRGIVWAAGHAITYRQKSIRLVVIMGPDDDPFCYRIAGLRNPNLFVPVNATLHVLVVNVSKDMQHDFRLGHCMKFFPYNMPYLKLTMGTPPLAPRSSTALHGEMLLFRCPSLPTYYNYLSAMPGHVKSGMCGSISVREKRSL